MAKKSTMVQVFGLMGNRNRTGPNHHPISSSHSTEDNEGTQPQASHRRKKKKKDTIIFACGALLYPHYPFQICPTV